MKPLQLEISGWGPYPKCEVVDFTKYMDGAIFLITGPTGAGKTTIFDAISYALFGEVSGSVRTKDSLRSDFCKDAIETYVKLTFNHKGETYEVRRNPRYMREKKRGTGTTLTPEEAVLIVDEEHIVTGFQKVNEKLKEILSIDYNQFKQISMIAQGEFLKLLITESGERVDIFRNIFNTQLYQQVQAIASDRARTLRSKMAGVGSKMEEACNHIVIDHMEHLSAARMNKNYMEVILLLNEAIDQQKSQSKNLAKELEQIEEKIKLIITKVNEAKQYEMTASQLQAIKSEEEKLIEERITCEKAIELLLKEEEEIDKKKLKIEEAMSIRQLFEEYEQSGQLLKKKRDDKEKLSQLMERNQRSAAKLIKSLKEYQNELSLYEQTEIKIGQNQSDYEVLLTKERLVSSYQEKYKEWQVNKKKLLKLHENYQKAELVKNQARQDYEEKDTIFKKASIGIAASLLVEGEPCPVCGSREHPLKATLSVGIPKEEELKELKNLWQKKENEYSEMYVQGTAQNEKVKFLQQDVKDKENEWNQSYKVSMEETINGLKEKKEEISAERKKLLWEKERKIQLNKLCNECIIKQEEEASQIEEAMLAYQNTEKEYLRLEGGHIQLSQKLPKDYKDKKQLETGIKNLEQIVHSYESKMRQYKTEQSSYDQKLITNKALQEDKRKQMEAQTKEGKLDSMDQLKIGQETLENQQNQKAKEKEKLLIALTSNKNALKSLKDRSKEKAELDEQYGIIGDLDQVLNGKNQYALKLEQYVLSTYFEEILKAANLRFDKMTNGRYELMRASKVADARTRNNLEIEVLDYYTGKKRSVKTLSGGESFKAALALALGLSDIVQNNAGGIEIDVLFIDEGFGALDDESLQQAINSLFELTQSNRLIGIISHVPELKERMEQQIVIDKTNYGSQIRS